MEGRRRRAQRLTQNEQEETEVLTSRQEELPQEQETASLNHPAQESESSIQRRRRQMQPPSLMPEHEEAAHPIPQRAGEQKRRAEKANLKRKSQPGKSQKQLTAPKTHRGERFRRATYAAKKGGKRLLKGLRELTVLALIMAQEGLKRLGQAAERMYSSAKRPQRASADTQRESAVQEYELTPVRPEEYRGRGKAHAQQTAAGVQQHASHEKKKNGFQKNEQLINRLISAALVCVAVFSAWQIGSIVLRSVRTTQLNEELSQQRAVIIEQRQELPDPDPELHTEIMQEPVSEEVSAQVAQPIATAAMAAPEATAAPAATPVPNIVKTMKYHQVGGDALPEMAALYEKNRDLVAWIQIPEVLDLPVVYRNNDYYLTRDFNKQKNASGTIFLDVNHPFKEKTQNLLLHGHNMKDGTMFGRLAQYLHDDTYLRYHPFIYFDTLWNKEQYVIFAVLDVSLNPKDERFFNYFTHDTFASDKEFATYIRQLQLRSRYAIPIDVAPSDALLTLSTCLEEDRLVIVARRLREGETRSDLRALVRMATRQ